MAYGWYKYPEERLAVGRDFALDLNGASIVGTPTIEAINDPLLMVEYIDTQSSVVRLWLSGGTAGVYNVYVKIIVATSENEELSARIALWVYN